MRNLLGRLHARPAADLDRIAAWWRVPLGRGDRARGIGALYRSMTDPIAARDAWERLDPDEAAVVRALVIDSPDHGATVPEIAALLRCEPAAAREVAVRLFRHGLLAREGDEAELPIGELPRLILPRELALLFRRILDEIDLGDRSGTPLRVLVEWLDDGEIDDAAGAWGLPVTPGTRHRSDVTRRLLRQIADPGRISKVVAGLRPDARRLWEAVRDAPGGAPVSFATAAAAAGLDADDAPGAARRLTALETLERSLLVLHTYGPHGQRLLFVPDEVRNPAPPPSRPLPALEPIPDDAVSDPPWRHPDALAWDLLSLLREVAIGGWPADAEPTRGRLRAFNRRLWWRGSDLPPAGYVPFLRALATAEGLLIDRDEDPPALGLGPNARRWRDMSFHEQTDRLRARWLATTGWAEAAGRPEIEVWGVDWRAARARLLALLADPEAMLASGAWFPLDAASARLAARDPDLLGSAFTAATARLAGEADAGGDEEDARLAATADAVGIELVTAFAWFGIVDVATARALRQRAVRLTATGRVLASGGAMPAPPGEGSADGAAIAIAEDGLVRLLRPSPLRIWALTAFAEADEPSRESTVRLTEAALARALNAGFDLAQVTSFLTRQAGVALPVALEERLQAWARGVRRVRVRRALIVTPDDGADLDAVLAVARGQGWPAEPHGEGVILLLPSDDPAATEAIAALRAAGLAPQIEGGSGGAQRRGE